MRMGRASRIAVIAAAVLVVVLLGAWSYSLASRPREMTGIVTASDRVALAVRNQSSAAGAFVVDRVTVPGDSWIVVTTLPEDDAPAQRVALAHVRAGTTRDLTLTLDPVIRLNEKVAVTLHADRGVPGRFEFDETRFESSPDKPYFASGKMVSVTVVKDTTLTSLTASAGGSVSEDVSVPRGAVSLEMSDRLTVIDHFIVDRVLAPEPSWVAMYNVDGDGAPVELVAAAPVPSGETLALSVPLVSETPLTDKVLVVLQVDRGTVGTFDFSFDDFTGSPDKPYAVGGSEVSQPVTWRGFGMSSGNAGDGGGM